MRDTAKTRLAWAHARTEYLLDSNQEGMAKILEANWQKRRIHAMNCSRQIGKSFFLVWLADQLARRTPRMRIKYAAETQKQVRAIVRPHFQKLLEDCPKALQPEFNTMDGEYRYPNGSTITIGGCETENDANKLLGQHAHVFIIDEAGSIGILDYVVKTIALPQTLNTRGRIIICSTPAKTPDHPFKRYCDEADAKGCLIERTIYDNPRITQEEIDELMEASGGEESTEWQREYLVRHVTDQDLRIVKFATQKLVDRMTLTIDPEKAKKDPFYYRPQFFDPYMGFDLGWAPDATGLVWGYLDYLNDTFVFEREFFMRRMDTDTLARVIKETEYELYGRPEWVFQRWGDCDERFVTDMQVKHSVTVHRTAKEDLHGAVNNLNLALAGVNHKIRIHPSCKQLREQFVAGVWDKNKKKFARSAKHGHYDLLAGSVYLTRNVIWDKPPERAVIPLRPRNELVVEEEPQDGGFVSALRSAFGLD